MCEGRNDTCEEYTGNVYVSDLLKQKKPSQSLFYVATIPKGVYLQKFLLLSINKLSLVVKR